MPAAEIPASRIATRAVERLRASFGRGESLAALAYIGVFALTVLAAYWALFSEFLPYDDEGFFEHGIRLFVHGHVLYNGFYSDYGPFPYELWGLLFRVAGTNITTDSGRLIQLGIWSVSSLALGLASHRLTHRLAVGISVQALSFAALEVMQNEPMHPGGLIVLLLALGVCIVVFGLERWPGRSLFALGVLVACVALTKINLGGYALIALAFATVMAHPSLRGRAWARRLVTVVLVAIGPAVMYANLNQQWAQYYAVLAVGGTLALALVAGGVALGSDADAARADTRQFLTSWIYGVLAAGVVVVAVILVLGSTLGAFILDTVGRASLTGSVLTIPIPVSSRVVYWALGAVAVAWGLRRSGELGLAEHFSGLATGLVRLLVGLAIWLSITGSGPFSIAPDAQFTLAMALAWVAALPSRHGQQSPQRYFVRLFIVALALLEGLDAYPVAGSQVGFGAVLFLVCGAICVADGLADIEGWGRERANGGDRRFDVRQLLGACATALAIGFVYTDITEPLQNYRSQYRSYVPLHINGAGRLRLEPPQAQAIETVVALLKEHCQSLVSLPGRFSFNDWTGLATPDDLTLEENAWLAMTPADNRQALRTLRTTPGLCVLQVSEDGPAPATGPVIRYIGREFRTIATTITTAAVNAGASDTDYPVVYAVEVRKAKS